VVCVTDANIWVDVHHADLLDAVFELPVTWRTPDIVLREVRTVDHDLLTALGLDIRGLPGEELNRIAALNARYPRPSPRDLAVLVVADVDKGIVITGDGPLRAAADQEGLEVHGVLWILDGLVGENVIPSARAAAALQAMVAAGSRLPQTLVQERLRQWS